MTRYRLSVGLLVGLAACSGGGGDSAERINGEAASVGDLDGATQLAIDAVIIGSRHFYGIGPTRAGDPQPDPEPKPEPEPDPFPLPLPGSLPGSPSSKSARNCDSGTHRETERNESVVTPYGTVGMEIVRQQYDHCRTNEGPESDRGRHYQLYHGASEFGRSEDQSLSYSGGSAADGTGALRLDYYYQDFESGQRSRLSVWYLGEHYEQQNPEHGDARAYQRYDLEWILDGKLLERSVEAFGTEQHPFHANQTADGLALTGHYERQFGSCDRSVAELQTVSRLVFDADLGHFTAGELQISQGEASSRARFDSAGQLHIQTSDGATRTLTRDEVDQAAADCDFPVILTDNSE